MTSFIPTSLTYIMETNYSREEEIDFAIADWIKLPPRLIKEERKGIKLTHWE